MNTAFTNLGQNFVAAVVYALLGVVMFMLAFVVFDRLTPGSLW